MSGRTTAEIVADLREWDDPEDMVHAEAVDRLVELCKQVDDYAVELCKIDALLPDGVSIEQLVATYNAVHNWTPVPELDGYRPEFREGVAETYAHLRSVKPRSVKP